MTAILDNPFGLCGLMSNYFGIWVKTERKKRGLSQDALGEMVDLSNATEISVVEKNTQSGLSKTGVVSQVAAIARQGNAEINFSGKNEEGQTLTGNNKLFQLKVPAGDLSTDLVGAAKGLYNIYADLQLRKILPVPEERAEAVDKIREIQQEEDIGNA